MYAGKPQFYAIFGPKNRLPKILANPPDM